MSTGIVVRLSDLVVGDKSHFLGELTHAFKDLGFEAQRTSLTETWEYEIACLKEVAQKLIEHDADFANWHLLLEYEILRRQKRPDGILLDSDIVFVIEFKLGESRAGSAERWQAREYALDLRDFHAASHERTIIPILCLEQSQGALQAANAPTNGIVWPVQTCDASTLAAQILQSYGQAHNDSQSRIDPVAWRDSAYRPTLTIVEAAQELFDHHDVREINHKYADNLTEATDALVEHISKAQTNGQRRICFLTGIPGAGKTLTGLNAVHDQRFRQEGRAPAIFLSGNGPLVKIIRSALTRNSRRPGVDRTEAKRRITTFIQNVHSFLKDCLREKDNPPPENVIVFDEAQRAWDAAQMEKKHDLQVSEPQLVLDVMERCENWCVIIALVGGGQEIHQGEAGLEEWGRALEGRSKQWFVAASDEVLAGGQSIAGHRLFPSDQKGNAVVEKDDRLHLKVSTRSWRALRFNEWVNNFLSLRPAEAAACFGDLTEFPMVRTRNLDLARQWLREHSNFDRRCGLVASSGALRLRAYGIELSTGFRKGYPYEEWFLAAPDDIRSSFRLEVAASEFEVQGLELDWVGLCWGSDLSIGSDGQWKFQRFTGSKWGTVRQKGNQQYIINKYRVLLTRARLGVVIWVPSGNHEDATIDPKLFDATYDYLAACGIPELAPR